MGSDETTHAETLLRFAANAEDGAILLVSAKGKAACRAGAAALAREQRLVAALRAVEAHHAQLNDSAGRPQTNSRTLEIVRAALTDTPEGR